MHNNLKNSQNARPGFHLGAQQKTHNIMTKSILCRRYREILFQKAALGYLLHFVQNGSSKNILTKMHNNLKHLETTWPGFHLGAATKTTKILQNQFYGKDTGKSSSRKLRRVIYCTLYRMDPKTTYKNTYKLHNNIK